MNHARNRFGHTNKKPEEKPAIYYLTATIREMKTDAKVAIAKKDSWARMRSNPRLYQWEQNRGIVMNHDVNNPKESSSVVKVMKDKTEEDNTQRSGKVFKGSGISAIYELGEALIREQVGQQILDSAKERIGVSPSRDWKGRYI